MNDSLLALLESLASNPWAIAALIILATFVLEDAATIAAGVLAIRGDISPPMALAALYLGIVIGDLGLYGIGRLAKASGRAKRWVSDRSLVRGRKWLRRRFVPAIIGARFTPGLRVPTFIASGFLRVSFWRFFATIAIVAAAWTGGLFSLIYFFGEMAAEAVGGSVWILGVIVLALAIGVPHLLRSRTNMPSEGAGS